MGEDIKGLIEKIQQEGVKAAEDKAREIENEGKRRAEKIIERAESEAGRIISGANEKSAKTEESTKTLLKQAARDMLLALKKEINAMLDRLIVSNIREALKPDELVKIIAALIKKYSGKDKVEISLSKEDLQKLEKKILSLLKEEVKKGITLKPSEDIHGGFIISFDAGKSHFDFTDKALAGHIGDNLKPKLKEILGA